MNQNIAIVLEATLGGTRKHVFDLLNNMPTKNLNVYFIYSKNRADELFFNEIDELKNKNIKLLEVNMTLNLLSFPNFKAFFKIRKYLKANHVEVIHLHGAIAGGIGRLASLGLGTLKKIIYTPHGGVLHKIRGLKGYVYLIIEKLLYNKRTYYIAVSKAQQDEIIFKLKIPNNKVYLIHNGISIPSENLYEYKLSSDIQLIDEHYKNFFLILYPALFLEAKGHLSFFNAIKNATKFFNPNIKFFLAGDGPLMEDARKLIVEIPYLKNKVLFLGFVKNLHSYYNVCDLVLLASKAEAFGYVALESFQYKKPVFATRVGGLIDIITEGVDGKFFSIDEIDNFIETINYYSNHKSELQALGENGFLKLKSSFSIKQMVDKTLNLYDVTSYL